MTKHKLQQFAEIGTFKNVLQPEVNDLSPDFYLKGKWNTAFFGNQNPLVLELGCGKGEYTLALAKKYPEINFIGIDTKGARIWRGAKTAIDENINNVAFIRMQIAFVNLFFDKDEVNEIWITFPDPQPSKHRRRLSSQAFLDRYKYFLKPPGIIHLKTDNTMLFDYTLELISENKHSLLFHTHDLYSPGLSDEILSVRTFYEEKFLRQGKLINYCKFSLNEEK